MGSLWLGLGVVLVVIGAIWFYVAVRRASRPGADVIIFPSPQKNTRRQTTAETQNVGRWDRGWNRRPGA